MKIKKSFLLLSLLITALPAAGTLKAEEKKPSILILPFNCPGTLAASCQKYSRNFFKDDAALLHFTLIHGRVPLAAPLTSAGDDAALLKGTYDRGSNLNAQWILAGSLTSTDEGAIARLILFSVKKKKSLYRTAWFIQNKKDLLPAEGLKNLFRTISGRARIYLAKKTRSPINGLSGSAGDFTDGVQLNWNGGDDNAGYALYRTPLKKNVPRLIGILKKGVLSWKDTTARPGLEYYYSIAPVIDGIPLDPGEPVIGYKKAEKPKGASFAHLLKMKRLPAPRIKSVQKRERARKELKFLKGFYKNKVELAIIQHIIRSYLKRGVVTALNNFSDFKLDYQNRVIYLYERDYRYAVTFKCARLFRLIVEAHRAGLMNITTEDFVLLRRLVSNGVAFAAFNKIDLVEDTQGRRWHIPMYEAAGISMEYYRNYRYWKKNTILFNTGNKELDRRIKNASRPR